MNSFIGETGKLFKFHYLDMFIRTTEKKKPQDVTSRDVDSGSGNVLTDRTPFCVVVVEI